MSNNESPSERESPKPPASPRRRTKRTLGKPSIDPNTLEDEPSSLRSSPRKASGSKQNTLSPLKPITPRRSTRRATPSLTESSADESDGKHFNADEPLTISKRKVTITTESENNSENDDILNITSVGSPKPKSKKSFANSSTGSTRSPRKSKISKQQSQPLKHHHNQPLLVVENEIETISHQDLGVDSYLEVPETTITQLSREVLVDDDDEDDEDEVITESTSVTVIKTTTPKGESRDDLLNSASQTPISKSGITSSSSANKDTTTPTAKTPSSAKSQSSPFSHVNFFQSSSKPNTPAPSKRKRQPSESQDSEVPTKKRESLAPSSTFNESPIHEPEPESEPEPRIQSEYESEAEEDQIPESESVASSNSEYLNESGNNQHIEVPVTPDPASSKISSFVTPENRPPNRAPPPTAPPLRSSGYLDATFPAQSPTMPYSTGKPRLSHGEKGRRISFMPNVATLNMSDKFFKSLQKSTPSIKFEKDLDNLSTPQEDDNKSEDISIKSEENESEISPVSEGEEESIPKELLQLKQEIDEEEEEKGEIGNDYEETQQEKKFNWVPIIQAISIFFTVFIFAGASKWFINSKFEVGYCEVGFDTNQPAWITRMNIHHVSPTSWEDYFDQEYIAEKAEEILDYFRPSCEPCPAHATCLSGFELICDDGFIKISSPFSLGGFLPIAPTCVPDTEKQKKVQRLTEKALQILREHNARFVCGYDDCPSDELEEGELRGVLYSLKAVS